MKIGDTVLIDGKHKVVVVWLGKTLARVRSVTGGNEFDCVKYRLRAISEFEIV